MLKKLNPTKVNQAFMALGGMVAMAGEVFIDAVANPHAAKYVLGASMLLVGIGQRGWGMQIVDALDGDTVPPRAPSMPPPEAFDAAAKPTVPDQPAAKRGAP